MNEEKRELDPRTAYMLAWRDRHIERLRELAAGYEEERRLLYALLQLCAEREAKDGTLRLEKAALTERLACEQLEVEETKDAYLLHFKAADGKGGSEGGGEGAVKEKEHDTAR